MKNPPKNPLLKGSSFPVAQVDTAHGKIYLYTSTLGDLIEVDKLGSKATPEARGHRALEGITSLEDRSQATEHAVPRLPVEVLDRLSEEDLGEIVGAYRKAIEEERASNPKRRDRDPVEPRKNGEPALVFLDRSSSTTGLRRRRGCGEDGRANSRPASRAWGTSFVT